MASSLNPIQLTVESLAQQTDVSILCYIVTNSGYIKHFGYLLIFVYLSLSNINVRGIMFNTNIDVPSYLNKCRF